MARIRCVVERITYQSPETGYTVLKTAVKGYQELIPVVGNMLDVNVGSVLLAEGEWKVDSRYGRQFVAAKWEETLPATVYGIEKYLGSGLIKGVGPRFARRIVRTFGAETLAVIEDTPERLREVEGIGEKRIAMIRESWEKQKEIKNIMLFLQGHDVSTAFAAKIYQAYGADAIRTVKENPYRLADDIWGIGFRTADTIARKLGLKMDSFVRIRAGLLYTLSQLADNGGHVFADQATLVPAAAAILSTDEMKMDESLVFMTLDHLAAQGDVITEPLEADLMEDEAPHRAIYLPPFYYAEIGVAGRLKKILYTPSQVLPEADIAGLEKRGGIKYDQVQREAIAASLRDKVMVLTGGPGTGKSTTTLGIIQALKAAGLRVALAAPTGRAAKRMTEVTGMEAKTIHRLLEYKPPEGYQRNEEHPIETDALIIDECSMIDLILMNSLLKAVPAEARLILIGDTNQLPSVGAGNVLKDIIASGVVPVVELKRIFRQAQTSRIVMNAHRINAGAFPEYRNAAGSDFFLILKEAPEETAEEIANLVEKRLPGYFRIAARDIQVLTPMQRGPAGAGSLNQMLQERLNRRNAEKCLRRAGYSFRLEDKVMQIRNNYDKDVYNGDIGTVTAVSLEGQTITVSFDGREIAYDQTELDELTLAYATTIHKAQGAEYPVVVMPVIYSHFVMLQRNLIYTGITRAKRAVVLVGSKEALSYAIRNEKVSLRNGRLAERLKGTAPSAAAPRQAAGQIDYRQIAAGGGAPPFARAAEPENRGEKNTKKER